MSRRKQRKTPPEASGEKAETALADAPSRQVSPWQAAEVSLRSLLALAGLVALGWSAPSILLLFFFDTLAALWAILAGAMFFYFDGGSKTMRDRFYVLASSLALSAVAVAFLALPLGFPVYLLFVRSGDTWQEALAQPGFGPALLGIAGLAMVGAATWSLPMLADETQGRRRLRAEFALVFGRWALIIMASYMVAIYAGRLGAVLVVMLYTVLVIYTELYPARFLGWFNRNLTRE